MRLGGCASWVGPIPPPVGDCSSCLVEKSPVSHPLAIFSDGNERWATVRKSGCPANSIVASELSFAFGGGLFRRTTSHQDGTEWAEATLTGNEKVQDTITCISVSGRPGHASLQVGQIIASLVIALFYTFGSLNRPNVLMDETF